MKALSRAAAYVGRTGRRAVPLAVLFALALPASAQADDPPRPTDIPAVSAYVEMVPTSRGPKQAGAGAARGRPLKPRIERLVRTQGGQDAPLLERLATSPAYGAPSGPRSRPRASATELAPPSSSGNALAAAIDAGGEGGAGRLLVLLVILTGVTAALGGAVALRRRPSRS